MKFEVRSLNRAIDRVVIYSNFTFHPSSRAKRIIRDGDTILAIVRPNLRSFLFIWKPEKNTITSTGFAVLRAKDNADPRFVYYAITDRRFTGYLTNNTKETSYPAVDTDTVLRGEIPDFDLLRQQSIAPYSPPTTT